MRAANRDLGTWQPFLLPMGIAAIFIVGLAAAVQTSGHLAGTALLSVGVLTGWACSSFFRSKKDIDAQEELTRRADAAEAATRAKSQFLANASHEIRSPLNAIYGYAQLIERTESGPTLEAARVIRRSAEHLTSLVEGLLDISQLEGGVIRIRSEPVNLHEFVEQLFWMMQPEASAKGIELKIELPAYLPDIVRMDPGRLRQVIINLISNAIKFTSDGVVLLRLRYWNQIAMFEVIDNGPGIPAHEQERIFVPFERGASEYVQRKPGAGLGLAISRAIVDMLGGQIELESEPGRGSCFRVTMMLGQVNDSSRSTAPREVVQPRITGYRGRKRSVLLVDDDARQRSFMRALLDTLGFEVTSVADGETAVLLGSQMSFDLAILDITLPGISGWQVAARLKGAQPDGLRVMMLSADVQDYQRPASAEADHDMFLTKPVEYGVLLDALAGLLELEWTSDGNEHQGGAAFEAASLGVEALPHFNKIRENLAIGHYRGVERCLVTLAEQLPDSKGFVDQMLEMLDQFDLAGMARKLENC